MSGAFIEKQLNKYKGYECWLHYIKFSNEMAEKYGKIFGRIVINENTRVMKSAVKELTLAVNQMIGIDPVVSQNVGDDNYVILGTFKDSAIIKGLINDEEIQKTGDEGFIIKFVDDGNKKVIVITGKTDRGVLYGTFSMIRIMQTEKSIENLYISESPKNPVRSINQWDNMDGSIERGYSGKSIFYENNQFTSNYDRIRDYARLLASVGINAISINNVNVKENETLLLTSKFLPDVARMASIFRAYGIKIFLSINFASPMRLGNLKTSDPLDSEVLDWWKNKVTEIYSYIHDFGGFLVKADSEFNPGPFAYGRDHAQGANMLAEALEPYRGLVIWRCFVYNCMQDWRDKNVDRACAAFDNFMPIDGRFKENVVLQIKNGPMDFQVREPVSPLIGGMKYTNQLMELQIAQEYTGQQKHICYLVPQWKTYLDFDTFAEGKGSTVKRVIDGTLFNRKYTGISAVSNIGNDENWTGHDLAQANLYGYGRLAWNPDLETDQITDEWIRMTFGNNEEIVSTIKEILSGSWLTYEKYNAPLGIGWMCKPNSHFGPDVDGYEFDKWGTYHRADLHTIGVSRSTKTGTGYTGQYYPENKKIYENLETCPEKLLLFFHRVPYTYRLKTGKTLIQHIYDTHFEGVEEVIQMKEKWLILKEYIDDARFNAVLSRLDFQIEHAKEWRDVINTYFYRKSGISDEKGRKIY